MNINLFTCLRDDLLTDKVGFLEEINSTSLITFENMIKNEQKFLANLRVNDKTTIMQAEFTLEDQIQDLKSQLTGDMFQDMDLKDKIHNLEMQANGVKPTDSHFDCVGCGS